MKKITFLIVAITCCYTGISQKAEDSVYRNYWYDNRTAYFRQLPVQKKALVFFGDSITQWGDWSELTGNALALNRGIAGDNTYGLLNRVDEVTRHAPERIFIMVGTNDINVHIPLAASLKNYAAIIERIKRESPNTTIYIQSVLPINNQLINRAYYTGTNEAIQKMNHGLDSLAREQHVVFVDLYAQFLDAAAQMDAAYTYDGLHLTATGYMKWIDILKKNGCLGQSAGAAWQNTLSKAHAGQVVSLPGFFSGNIPEINYNKITLPGPQFIMSDDPEYIHEPESIALQEKVQPGTVRLYVYNVNGVAEPAKMPRKITAVIKNTGTQIMHLRFLKYASQPPSNNYYQIGKQGLADYFASKAGKTVMVIKPGETAAIDPKLETYVANYDELVHGLYEFVIDQPGEISVLQTAPGTPGPVALSRLHTVVPPSHSNAGRGLFDVCNYRIQPVDVIDTKNGPVSLVVADGKRDAWITGKEGSTQQPTVLSGNYGVMYSIEVKWKSTDGKSLALITWNPGSGNSQWCGGMANTMIVSDGKYKGGIMQLPSDRLTTGGAPEAILIQVFRPVAGKEEQTITLTYSPPGASCLPTPLVFIPVQ